jgi:hypothetical protein
MSKQDGLLERGQSGQVLVYQPALTHSTWQDFECRAKTITGLERQLKAGVRDGRWVGWRIVTIHKTVMGIES